MTENLIPWITLTVFTPLLGAIVLALVPSEHKQLHRHMTVVFMGLTFVLSLPLVLLFDDAHVGYQLTAPVENVEWIAALGARYHVGIDGISLWLVMLTTFLGPIVALSGYSAIEKHVKEYHVALLVLQTAMLGALVSLDLLLFYIFWELMLVPMYFLIGVWGGAQRIYAAIKLFIYTMFGSVLMLVGIVYLYMKGGMVGFDITHLIEVGRSLSITEQRWLFVGFGLAFLIKVPLFPFHTWLPDAHVQAPTAGSVILASVLLKMGTYGLIRYAMPMLPDGVFWAAPYIAVLSVIGVIYGAVVAFVQKDVKKLVAYSSVSHLGVVTLGLFALTSASVTGALYQSLAHGITTGGLFLAIGIIYERRHTRDMDAFGGIARQVPVFAVLFLIVTLGSAGVPGLVGFIGEYLILLGSAQSYAIAFPAEETRMFGLAFGAVGWAFFFTAIAATGVILGALYLLHMYQKVMFGPVKHDENRSLLDVNGRELTYMFPVVAMCFVMGVFPQFFIQKMDTSVQHFIAQVEQHAVEYAPMVEENRAANRERRRFRGEGDAAFSWPMIDAARSGEFSFDNGRDDDGQADDADPLPDDDDTP
ncbi:MAG: NADH-quinone oxidoreductase subunit M [Deltaproteobacteria bacterium]|nr:MAG: NADH-quinone oxidoreductase subunit M [Deltaproteobacteria bacterium]